MKRKGLRFILICVGLYLIPCIATLVIRKNIPETDEKKFDSGIIIYISNGNTAAQMDLDEYIVGVVAASMPGDYPLEALKAQAVIARTYLMNTIGSRKRVEATELDQSYYSNETLREKYGSDYDTYYNNLAEAAISTTEEVLTYNGQQVTPVFFRCSNGMTRNAADVWGSELPYLVAVDSSEDTSCSEYRTQVTLKLPECIARLKESYPDFEANEESFKDTVQILEKDASGYVTKIQMGNKEFSGEELRYVLGLPSASFDVRAKSKTISFDVTGVGHGVGMSQWGARSMALSGKGYAQILSWYFPGTQLS